MCQILYVGTLGQDWNVLNGFLRLLVADLVPLLFLFRLGFLRHLEFLSQFKILQYILVSVDEVDEVSSEGPDWLPKIFLLVNFLANVTVK